MELDSQGWHLILRALAIRASNPQNALARISFHSPKSLPPPPPVTPTILVIFYFNYINDIHFSLKASFKLLDIYIYILDTACAFLKSNLPRSVLLVLLWALWITSSFRVFFFLFLFNDFRNPGNILPHIGKESLQFSTYQGNTHWSWTIRLQRCRARGRPSGF